MFFFPLHLLVSFCQRNAEKIWAVQIWYFGSQLIQVLGYEALGLASITKGRVLEPLRKTCLGSCSLPSLAGKEFQNFYSKVLLLILPRLLLQMLGMESVLGGEHDSMLVLQQRTTSNWNKQDNRISWLFNHLQSES